ncbi:hypothetical protein Bca52824_012864 [Brassica carinata]|uniref:AMP-dependent synthetase/ligase domain-containing protein n=1 Tax=Brassica carinata TaxID=52824 RepID=A0A8X7VXV2_BRACI|nr:hypothetical protein Bca52824_012864 [Brassica carinata]
MASVDSRSGSSRPYGLHRRLHRSKLTFAELWRAVESVGDCLSDMGIRKGHVVLLLSPNSILFPVVCLSVMSLGAVITTTNPLNTASEIAKQIKDSNPVLAFTTSQLLPKIAAASEKLPIVLMDEERVDQDDTATLLLFRNHRDEQRWSLLTVT